jgi:hypothetical protein
MIPALHMYQSSTSSGQAAQCSTIITRKTPRKETLEEVGSLWLYEYTYEIVCKDVALLLSENYFAHISVAWVSLRF